MAERKKPRPPIECVADRRDFDEVRKLRQIDCDAYRRAPFGVRAANADFVPSGSEARRKLEVHAPMALRMAQDRNGRGAQSADLGLDVRQRTISIPRRV